MKLSSKIRESWKAEIKQRQNRIFGIRAQFENSFVNSNHCSSTGEKSKSKPQEQARERQARVLE